MASFNILFAVGQRYIDKNHIKNIDVFMQGILDPDLAEDKKKSHYTKKRINDTLLTHLQTKVSLYDFLKENSMETDYKKGIFLHLITDYLFFNDFFDLEYIKNVDYENFCKDLYFSYDLTNSYLQKKYNINTDKFKNEINNNIKKDNQEKQIKINEKRNNILDTSKLNSFIEKVSDINLEEYKNKILEVKNNLLI